MGVSIVVALVVCLVTGVGLRVRSNRRMAQPWLNGVPLPAWDDHRWEYGYRNARLGAFAVQLEYGELLNYGTVAFGGKKP